MLKTVNVVRVVRGDHWCELGPALFGHLVHGDHLSLGVHDLLSDAFDVIVGVERVVLQHRYVLGCRAHVDAVVAVAAHKVRKRRREQCHHGHEHNDRSGSIHHRRKDEQTEAAE